MEDVNTNSRRFFFGTLRTRGVTGKPTCTPPKLLRVLKRFNTKKEKVFSLDYRHQVKRHGHCKGSVAEDEGKWGKKGSMCNRLRGRQQTTKAKIPEDQA